MCEVVPGAGHHILQFNSHEKIFLSFVFSPIFFTHFWHPAWVFSRFFFYFLDALKFHNNGNAKVLCKTKRKLFYFSWQLCAQGERQSLVGDRETDSNNDNEAHKALGRKGFLKKNTQKVAKRIVTLFPQFFIPSCFFLTGLACKSIS